MLSFLATANSSWLNPVNIISYQPAANIPASSMPTTLSEKAKGKQRATELEHAESEAPSSKDLTIRFTEGIPDLTVQVAEKDTVKDVKANVSLAASPPPNFMLTVLLPSQIRAARSQLGDRRLRLIHQGQLLADTAQLYPRIASAQERRRKSGAGSSSPVGGTPDGDEGMGGVGMDAAEEKGSAAGTTWLHCSVGPQLKKGEVEDEKVQVRVLYLPSCYPPRCMEAHGRMCTILNRSCLLLQTAQLKPLRGFDRLAAAGFSEQDIANIRLQFHTHSAGDYLDQEFDDQEDCTYDRRLEAYCHADAS